MQRIGLMGGSFNPIHRAHVSLARAALDGGFVDEVVFLPTGNPPHKLAGLADKLDRLAMVRLAIAGEENMRVSSEEIDRDGVIYTVDTLGALREKMPESRFFYIIGSDTLRVLDTWRRIDTVITLCDFLVAMRPGENEAEVTQWMAHWQGKGARLWRMQAPLSDASSTEVRERIEKGLPVSDLLEPAVEAYIRENGLYMDAL